MNGKLSLKIFSHHDQNIFFCKTLCQSLSSPRPRVASRVSAATWMEESNKKTVSKHPTPPGLGEQPLCPPPDILAIHLRWKFRKSDLSDFCVFWVSHASMLNQKLYGSAKIRIKDNDWDLSQWKFRSLPQSLQTWRLLTASGCFCSFDFQLCNSLLQRRHLLLIIRFYHNTILVKIWKQSKTFWDGIREAFKNILADFFR